LGSERQILAGDRLAFASAAGFANGTQQARWPRGLYSLDGLAISTSEPSATRRAGPSIPMEVEEIKLKGKSQKTPVGDATNLRASIVEKRRKNQENTKTRSSRRAGQEAGATHKS